MFQSLVVLHCELDPNNKSKIGLLFKQVEAKIFCFRPETCFRPIFIFHNLSDIQHAFLEDITARIALGTKNCELFYGYEAFEFLLHWTVGLLNPKYAFNDRFVLGKCREIWTTFTKNDAERLQGHAFLQIMPALFEDAHIIRRAITNNLEKIGMELRIKKTNALCKSSRIARERDDKAGALKFIYSFWNPERLEQSQEEISQNVNRLEKKIHDLQKLCEQKETEIVVLEPKDAKQKMVLKLTQAAIASCWTKRQLDNLTIANEEESESIYVSYG